MRRWNYTFLLIEWWHGQMAKQKPIQLPCKQPLFFPPLIPLGCSWDFSSQTKVQIWAPAMTAQNPNQGPPGNSSLKQSYITAWEILDFLCQLAWLLFNLTWNIQHIFILKLTQLPFIGLVSQPQLENPPHLASLLEFPQQEASPPPLHPPFSPAPLKRKMWNRHFSTYPLSRPNRKQ